MDSPQGMLEFVDEETLTGFRLERLEVLNWGTFDGHVWKLNLSSRNGLLTGDIGSGKSTLVDAITTLLVPPQRLAYNKAAGADARERSLRTYVLGHYKSERSEGHHSAKPVALRDHNSYTVILAVFHNPGFHQWITLAQVFWIKDSGPPGRFYVVAEEALAIGQDFAGFGDDVAVLRKRLNSRDSIEIFESYTGYAASFRRRLGISNEQALELFHQTVSMKSVGNLTDFVRQHMLEEVDTEGRIQALIGHFDNLTRAHDLVLRAKAQLERLHPLVADCDRYSELREAVAHLRLCRETLKSYFAALKADLLEKRLENRADERRRLEALRERLQEQRRRQDAERWQIRDAIAANGGDRIERLSGEIAVLQSDVKQRQSKEARYLELIRPLQLPAVENEADFAGNQKTSRELALQSERREAELDNDHTDRALEMREQRRDHDALVMELNGLKARRSNIEQNQVEMRRLLCAELKLPEDDMPFVGELLQVRPEERDWEGAAERVLRNFALALLVPDRHYAAVTEWVEATRLKGRLVYYRVLAHVGKFDSPAQRDTLVEKLMIKPNTPFRNWLEDRLASRFNYACCRTLEQFRREKKALTMAGQIKNPGDQHEKDDRFNIKDRTRYVLGWSNEAKIATLEANQKLLQEAIARIAVKLASLQEQLKTVKLARSQLQSLREYQDYREIDWRSLVTRLKDLQEEKRQLEAASNLLHELNQRLQAVDAALVQTQREWDKCQSELGVNQQKISDEEELLAECRLLEPTPAQRELFPALEVLRSSLSDLQLSVEGCVHRESELREHLTTQIDNEDKRLERLREKIVRAMSEFNNAFIQETSEIDAGLESAGEYRALLRRLEADDIPRFLSRFKELLNQNTIHEIAQFQSLLSQQRENISERIEAINESLRQIDYNPGRYIRLEGGNNSDADIRDFQGELRSCTEWTLTGTSEEHYSEAKFLQVKRIIERFRGREGQSEADRRWTRKVTDVRNWFVFAASERWQEDDSEHEHYSDSGGKSGGQKEKLAYTVLAASLAYQFGLERHIQHSRSFHFVVIDEAFGRGSDESARFGLELFKRLDLQLLIVTPLQKIHIIEPYVSSVGFVHNPEGRSSRLQNLTIEEYRAEKEARSR